MSLQLRSWLTLAVVSILALAGGYFLPRQQRNHGDMLDAVAAVQRRAPAFLISEPRPTGNWGMAGSLYLCRSPRTPEQVEALSKYPSLPDPRWRGVVCFKATLDPRPALVPWIADGGERCLEYKAFAVFGDLELLREVRTILAAEGHLPVRDY